MEFITYEKSCEDRLGIFQSNEETNKMMHGTKQNDEYRKNAVQSYLLFVPWTCYFWVLHSSADLFLKHKFANV